MAWATRLAICVAPGSWKWVPSTNRALLALLDKVP